MLERAKRLAEHAHQGQRDKGGHPYIRHPMRVMQHCETEEEKIVAVLHDVIEDTEVTLEELKKEGFSEEIRNTLVCLTHREGEGYMEYIERICQNPLAVRVKYADLQDNMDLSRIPNPTEKDYARLEKYQKAKARIEEAMKG
ncbi:MAG: GTP pyrophosphokinase [Anaerotignum sp.]|nr:GTP pyrophosphokinase [Anaerotignum sp.]